MKRIITNALARLEEVEGQTAIARRCQRQLFGISSPCVPHLAAVLSCLAHWRGYSDPERIQQNYPDGSDSSRRTTSGPQTSFWTTLSTLSNSAHISWHVPTGVIASANVLGLSGSARKPSAIAATRSLSR